MMEATGLSYKKLDNCLKKLKAYGEIIVKGNNRFSVVSVCDYDNCDQTNTIFDDDMVQQRYSQGYNKGTTNDTANDTTHLSTIEGRRKKEEDILVSPYSSYKKDKEGLAYDIKDRWNRKFEGKLKQVQRLTMPIKMAVMACIERFGMQSVDLVFEQVLMEHEHTGFVASFQFVFELVNYQGYLKRAQVRASKKQSDTGSGTRTFSDPKPQHVMVGVIEDPQPQHSLKSQEERKHNLMELAEYAKSNPKSASCAVLVEAYRSGELQRYGIDWKPNKD